MSPPPANRKFIYPEYAIPYALHMKPKQPEDMFKIMEKPDELKLAPRCTYLKMGAIATANGSAYMEYGNTKVLVCIQPLREMVQQTFEEEPLGVIICSVKYALFAVRDSDSVLRKRNSMCTILKKALDPLVCRHEFSNFELEINILVLDDDGCAISTAINCCGAALIDGGIPTYNLITASTVCIYKQLEFANPDGNLEQLISLCEEDVDDEYGIVVTACLTEIDQITECFHKGHLTQKSIEKLSMYSLELNVLMQNVVRELLMQYLRNITESIVEKLRMPTSYDRWEYKKIGITIHVN